jgi:hypothetical protein
VLAAAVLAVAATVLPHALGRPPAAGDGLPLQAAAATAEVLLALLVAVRVRVAWLLRDVVLTAALLVLGLADLVFGVLPGALRADAGLPVAGAVAGLAGGALLAGVAWLPRRTVPARRRREVPLVLATLVLGVLVLACGVAVAVPADGRLARLALLLAALAWAAAATGWLRRATTAVTGNAALAAAALLGAAALVDQALATTDGASFATAASALRCLCCLLLLVAVVGAVRASWPLSAAAVLEDRRRPVLAGAADGLELSFAGPWRRREDRQRA